MAASKCEVSWCAAQQSDGRRLCSRHDALTYVETLAARGSGTAVDPRRFGPVECVGRISAETGSAWAEAHRAAAWAAHARPLATAFRALGDAIASPRGQRLLATQEVEAAVARAPAGLNPTALRAALLAVAEPLLATTPPAYVREVLAAVVANVERHGAVALPAYGRALAAMSALPPARAHAAPVRWDAARARARGLR